MYFIYAYLFLSSSAGFGLDQYVEPLQFKDTISSSELIFILLSL